MNAITAKRLAAIVLVIGLTSAAALADGMIVPIRRDLRVRGHWAVKYHHVSIKVRKQVASVNIDQAFVNTGKGMIEVEYLFPVPPGAAIDSMTLVVDGKEYAARLLKADEARKIYEDIVRRKKDPALLEYAGFGLYKTRAFPLLPGKPVRVVVTYNNVCKRDRNLTEVWYPLNTEKFSAKPIEDVEVKVDIEAKADITAVYSPTHSLSVQRKGPRRVIATYTAKNALPIADFQAFYKTTDKDVGATLLTHQPYADKDGYFMLLVSPNPRLGDKDVVPKDVLIVLDRSGSMGGKKLSQAVDAAEHILQNLNKNDRFNLIAYSDSIDQAFEKLAVASDKNVVKARGWLDAVEPRGGTNIHEALLAAMKLPDDSGRPSYVIFFTDGLPTVGKTDEKEILAAVKAANKTGTRLFAFGVGYDVNVRLLDRLVEDNHGRSDYVKPKEPVEAKISSLYRKIRNPVMTNLTLAVHKLRLRDQYPRELGDLFDGDQIVLVGRYDRQDAAALPKGDGKHAATLVIKGRYKGKEKAFEYPVTVNPSGRDLRFDFVEKLWAIRRVGYLLDQIQLHGESKELTNELIRLAKEYGIMTPYTSFLADETTVLADRDALHKRAGRATEGLRFHKGKRGQLAAKNRSSLRADSTVARPTTAPGWALDKNGELEGGFVQMHGNTSVGAYEQKKVEIVRGVRQVDNQAIYRRGNVWIASNATGVNLKTDAAKIQTIERHSTKYFQLVKDNTVTENRIFATQRKADELVIRLRGQVYRIR